MKTGSLRKVVALRLAELGCRPRSGSLSATLKSQSTHSTALIPDSVTGADCLRSKLISPRIHCVALGRLPSSLSSSFSNHEMWLMIDSAMQGCCNTCKTLDVVITAAITLDLCPAALLASVGCFWGTAPSRACRMKEGQPLAVPPFYLLGEKTPDSAAAPRKSIQLRAATKGELKGSGWSQLMAIENFSRSWSLGMSLCGQSGSGLGSLRDPRGISRGNVLILYSSPKRALRPMCGSHFTLQPSPNGFPSSSFQVSVLASL